MHGSSFVSRVAVISAFIAVGAFGQLSWAYDDAKSLTLSTGDPFELPPDKHAEDEAESFISLLSVPDYHDRERATSELIRIGIRGFRKLRDAYVTTLDPEVKWRIERIVKTAYMDDLVYDRNGFLGIQQDTRFFPTSESDERIPVGHIGINVSKVIPDTAAWTAGVQDQDVIIMINGEPVPNMGQQSAERFGESIRTRGPGAKITLTIIRGNDEIEIEAILGRRPKEMYNGASEAINDMLAQARDQYDAWWKRYFVQPQEDAKKTE